MAWDLSNVIINLKAKIAEISSQIPGLATTSKAGIVKPDGTSITVTSEGTISATPTPIPVATTETAGIVKPDGSTITIEGGVISVAGPESVTITKTTGETWTSIVTRLCNAADLSKIKGTSYIKGKVHLGSGLDDFFASYQLKSATGYLFAIYSEMFSSSLSGYVFGLTIMMSGSGANAYQNDLGVKEEITNTEYPGETITLYY